MSEEAAPIALRHAGRRVLLKWHKLRRRPEDPPFSRANLSAGLRAGASLEVDLRRLACGRFVCLHDALLEGETSGRGPVAAIDAAAIARLWMRGANAPPLLLDELADAVRHEACAPQTMIQLDLKASAGEIDAGSCAAVAAALAGVAERFILSGCDWEAVTRLGAGIPGLALGYDPGDDLGAGGSDVVAIVRERAPRAETVYLHRHLVRSAHERGDPLVARLQERGHRIDSWTIDHGTTDARADLLAAIASGCDQVTTNSPAAWAAESL